MSTPHIVSEPANPLDYYRRLQMAEGELAELRTQLEATDAAALRLSAMLTERNAELARLTAPDQKANDLPTVLRRRAKQLQSDDGYNDQFVSCFRRAADQLAAMDAMPICGEHRQFGKSHDGECFGCALTALRQAVRRVLVDADGHWMELSGADVIQDLTIVAEQHGCAEGVTEP